MSNYECKHEIKQIFQFNSEDALNMNMYFVVNGRTWHKIGWALVEDNQIATVIHNGGSEYKVLTAEDMRQRKLRDQFSGFVCEMNKQLEV